MLSDGVDTLGNPKVGLVFDDYMTKYYHLWVPDYPDCPDRLKVPLDKCAQRGLIKRCQIISPRKATKEEVTKKHSEEYHNIFKMTSQMQEDELKQLSMKFDGIYFHPNSYDCAMLAAGCAIEAVEYVLSGKVDSAFAVVRPPGHHATRDEACGYCYLNNIALATSHALDKHGLNRILIVDWDVHHGQGTQFMFYDDPRVLFFSSHRYEHSTFWPNLRQSDYDFIGDGAGKGFNINVPINDVGIKDGDFMAIFQQILLPVAFEFQPEFVLISCGFDAVVGDRESKSHVTPACFAHLTHLVKGISNKTCFIYEGGYCLKSLSESMALTLRTLLDDPCPQLPPLTPPCASVRSSILNSIRVLRPFWRCLKYQIDETTSHPSDLDMITPKQGLEMVDIVGPEETYELNEFEKISLEEVEEYDKEIDKLIKETILISPPNRTCLAFDDLMLQHKQILGCHPERPDRIRRVKNKLEEMGLWKKCHVVEKRKATFEELNLIHDVGYINEVEKYGKLSEDELNKMTQSDHLIIHSIYICKSTFESAVVAVGNVLNVVDEVLSGRSRNGFAIVRPPGHHARRNEANGFCFFNSIAIAAKYCQERHQTKRVMILDWDVHHGNGTQQAFYSDSSVLFVSIHRRDGGKFYPFGDENSSNQVGEEEGKGFNINIPWSKGRQGDAEYMAAFQQIILPVAYQFSPDVVLVSAGFDAAIGDPIGGCCISPEMFGHMTHMLSSLASGRLILVLEGGYNLNSISSSAASCVSVLLGNPLPPIDLPSVNDRAIETIREVIKIQQNYWKSLAFYTCLPPREATLQWLEDQMYHWNNVRYIKPSERIVEDTKTEILKRDGMFIDIKATCADINDPTLTPSCHVIQSPSPLSSLASSQLSLLSPDQQQPSSSQLQNASLSSSSSLSPSYEVGGDTKVSIMDDGLLNFLSELALGEDHLQLHAVEPLAWCPHVDHVTNETHKCHIVTKMPCFECCDDVENWICLSCFEVYCSRFRSGHMVKHTDMTEHPLVLSFSDLSIWCYQCDAYIDNELLRPLKDAAYQDKFQCQMPHP